MREVGSIPTKLNVAGFPDNLIEDIRWVPDSKNISFIFKGTLYVVPVEPRKQ